MAASSSTLSSELPLVFPPLHVQSDPLATLLVASETVLSQRTLRAALILNKSRITAILGSWFQDSMAQNST